MLIKVTSKTVPTIARMHNLAMKHIFEPQHMSQIERIELEHGIEWWPRKNELGWDEKTELARVINALIANEGGYFNDAKATIKRTGIDYRKLYAAGLPYINVDTRLPEYSGPGPESRIIDPSRN